MAKPLDEKTQAVVDKAVTAAGKTATKEFNGRLKAEIDRVKASDLSNAEKKAAIASLKNLKA